MREPVVDFTTTQKLRVRALELATQAAISEGKPDGQTIIRRAVGFYEFLNGNINKKKDTDGLTSP